MFIMEGQTASVASRLPQSPRSGGLGPSHHRGPRKILAIENTNKYVAINMQLMYNFAEIYEN